MRNFEIYERRASEAEALANLVGLPQNRARYLALAKAWRALMAQARARQDDEAARAA